MRSIELTFKDATDARIRSEWATLADAGVPSLAGHTGPSNRPHITLAAGPDLQLSGEVQDILRMLPVRIGFSGALVFPGGPGKYVLARSIVLTKQLLELHRFVHQKAAGALPLTLPDAWTPHVTLARRVPHHLLGKAVDLLDLRLEGLCTDARLWDSGTRTVTPLGST
jgi:2'-5' RNA ligase